MFIRKKAASNGNVYAYKTIDFQVLPKWYQAKWFYFALIAKIVIALIILFFWQRHHYRSANKMLKQKVTAATISLQQINSTLEKKVEERTFEIQQAEIKFRTLVERSAVGVYIVQENKFMYVNPRFEAILGYDEGELIGENPLVIFDKADREAIAERIRKRISGELESNHYQILAVKKDGTPCYLEFFGSRTIYNGNPTIIGTLIDISVSAKMQTDLKGAERKFRDLVEKSLVGVYIVNDNGLLYMNPHMAEMFGYTQEDLKNGFPHSMEVHEEDKEIVEKNLKARFEGKVDAVQYEFRGIKKDGSIIHVEVFGKLTEFEGSRAIIGTMIDVTEKKLSEQQLIKEKNLSQSIINNLPGIFYVIDKNGKYLLWNKNLETVSGYTASEISNITTDVFITQQTAELVSKTFEKVHAEGYAEAESTLLTKDRRELSYYFNGVPINYNEQECILGVAFDISERKKAQQEREIAIEALRKSEANLNTIFFNTDTGYMLLDIDFKIIAFNQRARSYFKKLYDVNLMNDNNFADYIGEKKGRQFIENAKSVLKGNLVNYEKSHVNAQGKLVWYHIRKFPVLDANNNVLGMMIAISDVTEKKLLEQEILEQKIQEQKKVIRAMLIGEEQERNKIGQELHDNINQILAGTKLYLSVVRQEKSNSHHIRQSMQLLDSAIEEIRELSKHKVTPHKRNSLPEMLGTLVDNFYVASKMETEFLYGGPTHLIDEELKLNIYRIVQEQLNNIIKHAHAENVTVKLEVGTENISLLIADDGVGFDLANKKNGIGIANMINRIESFNGNIEIKSSPGNGCRIEIKLPV